MLTRFCRSLCVIALLLAVLPGLAHAQGGGDYASPFPVWPIPVPGPPYTESGPYAAAEFVFMRQSNPIKSQLVAVRGLIDADGTITGTVGAFLGSGEEALNTEDVSGPVSYQPGVRFALGWRFDDGHTIELNWMHLSDARYSAVATLAPKGLQGGQNLANTFLTSDVYNFPVEFAGAQNQVSGGSANATFGIWNASTSQQLMFIQRFDQVRLTGRIPAEMCEDSRTYGILGVRAIVMFERFTWRTIDADATGAAGPDDVGLYYNVVSNRLYGLEIGVGKEWSFGATPIGLLSGGIDVIGSPMLDVVKERVSYLRGDLVIGSNRARNQFTLAPMVDIDASLRYYPTAGIQVRVGYDFIGLCNTIASPNPVDFDYGRLTPGMQKWTWRFVHGIHFGVSIAF